MRIFIVGAGGQGGPCTAILARDQEVEQVVLADIDLQVAEKVKKKVGSDKVKTARVDAGNVEELVSAGSGCDVIIDLVLPWLAPKVIEAAHQMKIHYVNTAFDKPFWGQLVSGEPLLLDREMKEAGLTALLGCGMAPGFLNILTRYYTDQLDRVKTIKLRLGKKKTDLGPYEEMVSPWNPGWAPVQALIDCAENPYLFRDGRFEEVDPYSEIEEWEFPEPVGRLPVSHHSHEEVYSMPGTIGKGLEYCDFKYFVQPQPAALVSMGFASREEVDVKGQRVKPLDLVAALLPKPGSAFLEEEVEQLKVKDKTFFTSMMIYIEGEKDGARKEFKVNCPNFNTPGPQLLEMFGTSLVNVALPAIIGAKMAIEGAPKGIVFPEEIDVVKFLDYFKATGIPYRWEEL